MLKKFSKLITLLILIAAIPAASFSINSDEDFSLFDPAGIFNYQDAESTDSVDINVTEETDTDADAEEESELETSTFTWKFQFKIVTGIGLAFSRNTEKKIPYQSSYYQFYLRPYFRLGPFSLALNLDFAFFPYSSTSALVLDFRRDDWDPTKVVRGLLGRLELFSFKMPGGKPVWIKFAKIPEYTFGNGTIMQFYSNSLFSTEFETTGLLASVDFDFVGGELMLSDITTGQVFGMRIWGKPLMAVKKNMPPQLRLIEVGITYVADTQHGKTVIYEDDRIGGQTINRYGKTVYTPSLDPGFAVQMYGFDVGTRVVHDPRIILNAFIDVNKLDAGGFGMTIGVDGNIYPTIFNMEFVVKVNIGFGRYMHDYFNRFYETNRLEKYWEAIHWPAYVGISIFVRKWWIKDMLGFSLLIDKVITQINGAPGPFHVMAQIELSNLIPGFLFKFIWDRANVTDNFAHTFIVDYLNMPMYGSTDKYYSGGNTVFILEVGFEISRWAHIVFKYHKKFLPRLDGSDADLAPDMTDVDYASIQTRLFF